MEVDSWIKQVDLFVTHRLWAESRGEEMDTDRKVLIVRNDSVISRDSMENWGEEGLQWRALAHEDKSVHLQKSP